MIRKLVEKDRAMTMDFLGKEPAINLFIIGDIEGVGFDEDFQELWGQFDDEDRLEGVLLRFHENFIPYFVKDDFDTSHFKDIITKWEGKVMMSGKESVLNKFDDILLEYRRRSTYFCELVESSGLVLNDLEDIKEATTDDAERVFDMLEAIEEFSGSINSVDRIKHKLETKTGRIYYYEDGDKITSIAQTTAENSMSAMVVGVATLEAYRNKGLVSRCLSKLCHDILQEGKSVCLFYDNPNAGKIYHRLGFKTLDNWMMISDSCK